MRWLLLLVLGLSGLVVRAADPVSDALQQGLLAEEVQHDLDAAIAAYQSVISLHDDQRRLVATALFRLGESYRKQGKTANAIAQYRRLATEFGDQTELARLSREQLELLAPGTPVVTGSLPPAQQRQKELLAQELALVEQQIAETRKMMDVGRASSSDLIPLQREALSLQRQMAALDATRVDLLDVQVPSTAGADPSGEADASDEEQLEIERLKQLIRNSPDLINSTTRGEPPLHGAAAKGQLAVAQFLIDGGADPNGRRGDGSTPLHRAVSAGSKAMTELLIAAGADVNSRSQMENTPLHQAASLGYTEIAKVLLANGADVNAAAPDGTPLHFAVMQRQVAMIDLLLDSGAEIEGRTSQFTSLPGATALFYAVSASVDPSMVERLLARGANVNATNAAGDRVLHAVLASGPVRALQAVLEQKPDLEVRGSRGFTPLQDACSRQNTAAAIMLLEAGANPNVRFESVGSGKTAPTSGRPSGRVAMPLPPGVPIPSVTYGQYAQPNGQTPLHWAVLEWNRELTRALLEHGADPNAKDHDGATPLLGAVLSNMGGSTTGVDPVVIQLVLDAGADPNVIDKDGMSLLRHALRVGSIELMAALLSRNVDPNIADPAGATPMHVAALWDDSSAARLLLDHGADVSPRDHLGNTPLHVAARAGKKDVLRLLLERGAPVDARNKRNLTPLDLAENDSHYAIQPGRGLIEAFDRRGVQVKSVAARVPTDIADILIQHGAPRSSTGSEPAAPDPASSVPPAPDR